MMVFHKCCALLISNFKVTLTAASGVSSGSGWMEVPE